MPKALVSTESLKSRERTPQILGLDLIRCAAALVVLLFHYGFYLWTWAPPAAGGHDVSYHWMAPFAWFGWIGVEIFFVLSGFVIAYSAKDTTAFNFCKSRLLRLYPTAWICATFTFFAVVFCSGLDQSHSLINSYVHTLTLAPWTQNWIDGPYWTLPIELAFYSIIFTLLRFGIYRYLGRVMIALGLFSATVSLYEWAASAEYLGRSALGERLLSVASDPRYQFLLFRYGVFFAIGSLLWLCLFEKISSSRVAALIYCVIGAIAEIDWHSKEMLEHAFRSSRSLGRLHSPSFIPIYIWAAAVLLIILACKKNHQLAVALRPIGAHVTRTLGLMTYPIYLLHQRIGFILMLKMKPYFPDFLAMVFAGLGIITASYLMVTYLDKPVRKLVGSLFDLPLRRLRESSSSLP
jgi:peptidoglycan/LPS O-acetylase OafA/YrhL